MIETNTLKRSSTNSDVKMEVNAISDYLKPNMPLPQYLPYARFLLDTDLSHTAKLLYTLLLDRATLSQKNNWIDAQGHIYVIYPLSNLAKDLGCCVSSVTRSFTELEKANLVERVRYGFSKPSHILLLNSCLLPFPFGFVTGTFYRMLVLSHQDKTFGKEGFLGRLALAAIKQTVVSVIVRCVSGHTGNGGFQNFLNRLYRLSPSTKV